jgi:hypothetical protein
MKAVLACSLILFVYPVLAADSPSTKRVYAVGDHVRVRSFPDTASGNPLAALDRWESAGLVGQTTWTATIDEKTAPWDEIVTDKNIRGWAFGGYLAPNPEWEGVSVDVVECSPKKERLRVRTSAGKTKWGDRSQVKFIDETGLPVPLGPLKGSGGKLARFAAFSEEPFGPVMLIG